MTTAEKLKNWLQKKGWSYVDLAEKMDLPEPRVTGRLTVLKWVHGRAIPLERYRILIERITKREIEEEEWPKRTRVQK